jgi:hypothetical protein
MILIFNSLFLSIYIMESFVKPTFYEAFYFLNNKLRIRISLLAIYLESV